MQPSAAEGIGAGEDGGGAAPFSSGAAARRGGRRGGAGGRRGAARLHAGDTARLGRRSWAGRRWFTAAAQALAVVTCSALWWVPTVARATTVCVGDEERRKK